MMNMTQVKRGQIIQTPFGAGKLTQIAVWLIGDRMVDDLGYQVELLAPHKDVCGLIVECDYGAVRPLNPGVWFPGHAGEILRSEWK